MIDALTIPTAAIRHGIGAGRREAEPQTSVDPDVILLQRAAGDPSAFAAFYRKHYPAIVGYLHRRVGCAQTAEDLAGDTFLAAYRTVHRFRAGNAPASAWLYRIATNAANRWAKRARREAWLVRAAGRAACPPDEPAGDAALRALLTLHPDHQAVLSLHHVEGMELEVVSMVLGVPVGTVKSRLSRARVALRAAPESDRASRSTPRREEGKP